MGTMGRILLLGLLFSTYLSEAKSSLQPFQSGLDLQQIQIQLSLGLQELEATQSENGSWNYPVWADTIYHNAAVVILYEILGVLDQKSKRVDRLMSYLWSKQSDDGSFKKFKNGPDDPDQNVMAYIAAKITGESENSNRMLRLEKKIQENGGITQVSYRALSFLFLLQLDPRRHCLNEKVFHFLFKQEKKLPWLKTGLLPILYILAENQSFSLSKEKVPNRILQPTFNCPSSSGKLSSNTKNKFLQWLNDHTNSQSLFFGYVPTAIPALIAFSMDPLQYSDKVSQGLQSIEKLQVDSSLGIYQSPGDAAVGETLVVAKSLLEMKLEPTHPLLRKSKEYLIQKWQPNTGGFGFSDSNEYFPDPDDTAYGLSVLSSFAEITREENPHIQKTFEWILSMQNSDGGFPTWEKENSWFFQKLPKNISQWIKAAGFSKHSSEVFLSESVPEHTARILIHLQEALDRNLHILSNKDLAQKIQNSIESGFRYLLQQQNPDGSFESTWYVNYLIGTSMVLPALTLGPPLKTKSNIQQALEFIFQNQNQDGGFSESPWSFEENRVVPLSQSSPTQTGIILSQILLFNQKSNYAYWDQIQKPIESGIQYLLSTQSPHGSWDDSTLVAVGVPKTEYATLEILPTIEPLEALGTYLQLFSKKGMRRREHLYATSQFYHLNFFKEGKGMHLVADLISYGQFADKIFGKLDRLSKADETYETRWGVIRNRHEAVGLFSEWYKGFEVGALGCVACHSGKAAGQFYIGLGNKNIDVSQIGKDAAKIEKIFSKSLSHQVINFKQREIRKEINRSAIDFAERLADPDFTNLTQGLVPTSMIRWWFFNIAGEPLPQNSRRGAVKVPQLWGYGLKRKVGQFSDGFGNGERPGWGLAVELTGGQSVENIREMEPKIEKAEQLLELLLPPQYPFPINHSLAHRGKLIFQKNCTGCHGHYNRDLSNNPIYQAPKHIPIEKVKTDSDRLLANTEEFKRLVKENPLSDLLDYTPLADQPGYFAPRLEGVWARFPYLHNGSVPHLHALLSPPSERPKIFSLKDAGERYRFDPETLGLTIPEFSSNQYHEMMEDFFEDRRWVYNTRLEGQSNQGHFFGFMKDFSEQDKKEIIEYLKTL